MRPLLCRFFLVALGLAVFAGSAAAQSHLQAQIANRWAANNALFVLYHEAAHLLIDQLDLPVLGREEDAADNMATHALLAKPGRDADQALIDAARGWRLSDVEPERDRDLSYLHDPHSGDLQRAYAIVCLMVGFDKKTFEDLADQYGMDAERQQSCIGDYKLLERSLALALGADEDKHAAATEVRVRYDFVYGPLEAAAGAFRKSGVLEQVAEDLRAQYSISNAVTLRARTCDEPNAHYVPERVEVIFCYELMDHFLELAWGDMANIEGGAPEVARLKDKVGLKAAQAPIK